MIFFQRAYLVPRHRVKRARRRRRQLSPSAAGQLDAGAAAAAGLQPEDLNTDGIDPSGADIWPVKILQSTCV